MASYNRVIIGDDGQPVVIRKDIHAAPGVCGRKKATLVLRLSDGRLEEALEGREEKLRNRAEVLGLDVYAVRLENDILPDGRIKPASAYKRKRIKLPNGKVELRTDRPVFRAALDDILSGRAQVLIFEDLDRAFRQPRDGEDLLDAVEISGASALSLTGTLALHDGGDDNERFMARTIANVAAKSSADTARRVRDSRARLAGVSFGGGPRRYGFRPDPDAPKYHKTLVIVEDEAFILRAMADDILDRGLSLRSIAQDLRDRGIPTASGRTAWSAASVRTVLLKPAVAGLAISGNGALLPAPWPAIITRERWQQLVATLTDPVRRTNHVRGREPRWLMSGFATCAVCGKTVQVKGPGNNTSPNARRYQCYAGHACRNAKQVDDYIEETVLDILEAPAAADLLKPPPPPGTDTAAFEREIRALDARRKTQLRMHAAGVIGDDELQEGLAELGRQREALARRLEGAGSSGPDPLAEFRNGTPARLVWASLSMTYRRAVVQRLFESVQILPYPPGRRRGYGLDTDLIRVTHRR